MLQSYEMYQQGNPLEFDVGVGGSGTVEGNDSCKHWMQVYFRLGQRQKYLLGSP